MKINSTLSLAIIILLIFFIHPFVTWFVADDYIYMKEVQAEGVFKRMWQDYLNWDGRCIGLTYPFSRFGLWLGKYWFGPLLGSVLMMLSSFIIIKSSNLYHTTIGLLKNTTLVVALLWLASFNFSSQTLYWTTGISYQVDVILLLLSYYLIQKFDNSIWQYIISVPLFFYAGTVSPGAVLALFSVVLIDFLSKKFNNKALNIKPYILFFICSVIGLLVVVLSPGNASRLTGLDAANLTHIWTVYFNVKRIFSQLFEYNTAIIWMLITVGLIVSYFNVNLPSASSKKQRLFLFLDSQKWLIAAFVTVLFFIPMPSFNSPRTNIHFVYFSVFYAFQSLGLVLLNNKPFYESKLFLNAFKLISVIFIVIASTQLFDARYVQKQMVARDIYLRTQKGEAVIFTSENIVRPSQTRRFEDVSNDTSYWLNKGVANYYGLKYIKGLKDKNDN